MRGNNPPKKLNLRTFEGLRKVNEVENSTISAVKFSLQGNSVAFGSKEGQLFVRELDQKDAFGPYCHDIVEYHDSLKEQSEKKRIKKIQWLSQQGKYKKIITLTKSDIVLWKIFQKPEKLINKTHHSKQISNIFLKSNNIIVKSTPDTLVSAEKSGYGEFNDMGISHNEQFLLTSGKFKVFLWNLEKIGSPFQIGNISQDQQGEEISCMKCHPFSDSHLIFGTNFGKLFYSDMRTKRKINFQTKSLSKSLFGLSSIDFCSRSGKHVLARDPFQIKIWDIAKTDQPILTLKLLDPMKSDYLELTQQKAVNSKFSMGVCSRDEIVVTGNYNSCFNFINTKNGDTKQFQIKNKNKKRQKNHSSNSESQIHQTQGFKHFQKICDPNTIEFVDWHPQENIVAVCWKDQYGILGF